MPRQTTLQGVSIAFERHEIDGEKGWVQTIVDPVTAEVILIPIDDELAKTFVKMLTGVEVVTDVPPSLVRKMAEEGRA